MFVLLLVALFICISPFSRSSIYSAYTSPFLISLFSSCGLCHSTASSSFTQAAELWKAGVGTSSYTQYGLVLKSCSASSRLERINLAYILKLMLITIQTLIDTDFDRAVNSKLRICNFILINSVWIYRQDYGLFYWIIQVTSKCHLYSPTRTQRAPCGSPADSSNSHQNLSSCIGLCWLNRCCFSNGLVLCFRWRKHS